MGNFWILYTLSEYHFISNLILADFWQLPAFLYDMRRSFMQSKLKLSEGILKKVDFSFLKKISLSYCIIPSELQSFTNILHWSNDGTNLHCDPLAQWYGFGFAFQRYQVRACNGSKTFLFHFMSVLRAFRVRILVKMALFPQPSSVMPPTPPLSLGQLIML